MERGDLFQIARTVPFHRWRKARHKERKANPFLVCWRGASLAFRPRQLADVDFEPLALLPFRGRGLDCDLCQHSIFDPKVEELLRVLIGALDVLLDDIAGPA